MLVSLWPERSFVLLNGCIVTDVQDTERTKSTEEIIHGPWVSNQWGNSSRITHIKINGWLQLWCSSSYKPLSNYSPYPCQPKEIFKCQWWWEVSFFHWFSVMCPLCELGCTDEPLTYDWDFNQCCKPPIPPIQLLVLVIFHPVALVT